MDVVSQFLTVPMFVLSLVIWVFVWLQRKVVEFKWPTAKTNKYWRELFLPAGPIGTGAIIGALAAKYPFPEMLTSLSGRVFCGIVCGLCSGLGYKLLKQFIASKADPNSPTKTDTVDPLPSDE